MTIGGMIAVAVLVIVCVVIGYAMGTMTDNDE